MSKITLNAVGSLLDATTAATTINNNSAVIVAAWDNTLSRDGTTPNQMEADLDMNSNDILNVNKLNTETLILNGQEIVSSDLSALPAIADGEIFSNISGSSNSPVGNSLTSILDHVVGNTQGSILYRNASDWTSLLPGSSGQFLRTGGSNSNPTWNSLTGGGDVLAANDLSEYTATQTTARNNIGAISVAQSDVFQGLVYKNNLDNAGNIDVWAGFCHDSTGQKILYLNAPMSKWVGGNWAVGNGSGCLDTGVFIEGAYFIHLIYNPTSNITDFLVSFSPFAPLMPSGYTFRRLIGSFYATVAGVSPFTITTDGWMIMWTKVNSIFQQANGSSTYLRTLNVPKGVKCEVNCLITASGTNPVTWPGAYLIIKDAELGFVSLDPSNAYTYYGTNQTAIFTANFTTSTAGNLITGDTNTDPPIISIDVYGWRFDKRIYR